MIIDTEKFNEIIKREESLRDQLPRHTLDWHMYSNRLTLLNEVKTLFSTPIVGGSYRSPIGRMDIGYNPPK